jgi:hypothetical protein
VSERDPAVDKAIEDALDQLFRMEKLLTKIDRNKILSALENLKKALGGIEDLQEALEAIPHTELDMRMARLRIQAITGLQPPSLASDPDRTPVEHMQVRRPSSSTFKARGETQPGLGTRIPHPKKP